MNQSFDCAYIFKSVNDFLKYIDHYDVWSDFASVLWFQAVKKNTRDVLWILQDFSSLFTAINTVALELYPYANLPIVLPWAYSWNGDKVGMDACGSIGWTLKVYIWQALSVSTMLNTGSSCWEIALLLQPIITSPRAFTGQSELGFRAIGERVHLTQLAERGFLYRGESDMDTSWLQELKWDKLQSS